MHEKLDDVQTLLLEIFYEIPGEVVVKCLDPIKSYIIGKDVHSPEEIRMILNIKKPVLTSGDFTTLILSMSDHARESSRGAASLFRVYVSEYVYNILVNNLQLEKNTKLRVGKAEILPNSLVKQWEVLGLCKPKFQQVAASMLVIGGVLEQKEVENA